MRTHNHIAGGGRRSFNWFLALLASIFIALNLTGSRLMLPPNFRPVPIYAEPKTPSAPEIDPRFALADDPFCDSLRGALARGPANRAMIHAVVSNSGHLPFLRNLLLGMRRNGMPWTPLVLSVGAGVCPALENATELRGGRFVCVPYLDRLLVQLRRDEPESVEQIQPFLRKNGTVPNDDGSSTEFGTIDATFYGWGSVEHKFLINAKLYALRDVLECGADAFVTDTDVGFRRDPRPYLEVPGPRGDVVAQNDTNNNYKLSLNSGFMYWKRTRQNLDLIHDIITVPPFWHVDQARVNARMHNRSTPHTLLDALRFPNGYMFNSFFDELDDVVVFHANWNTERHQKEEMLQKIGLWFLNETVG